MNTAITSLADVDDFRKIWIEKFDKQAQLQKGQPKGNAWEGFDAYRELNDTNNLWRVLPTAEYGDAIFKVLTGKLAWEVHIYNLYKTSVVADNQCFKTLIGALSAAEAKLKKTKTPKSNVKTELDERLRNSISAIEEERRSLERLRVSYWQVALLAEVEERMKLYGYSDVPEHSKPLARKELADWERIFDNARYPRNLVKQIDLDTRFQLRVAVILRLHLRQDFGVSLRTISRLTVLTYICGKLRIEGPDRVFLKANVRSGGFGVGGVDQKLRAAGIK